MKRPLKITLNILLVIGVLTSFRVVKAKDTYPKLANYYLKYFSLISDSEYNQLRKWDLLVIPNQVSLVKAGFLDQYKRDRADNTVLAYVYPAMSMTIEHTLFRDIEAANLWLRNPAGDKLQIWPGLYAVNLTRPEWQNMNLSFINQKLSEGRWDGIMYDTVDTDITRYSANGIDINGDGRADDSSIYNSAWQRAMSSLFNKTRQQIGPEKIIMMNGSSIDQYQPDLNGRIFEMFPTPWEGNGSWQATMYQYLRRLPGKNKQPNYYLINGSTNNSGRFNDYQKLRFGLASTLLGDGYFSFDFGDKSHEQLWWYDEYDIPLGHARSSYYNLLEPNNDYIKAGLWRRDFEYGTALVNSTNKDQLYVFKKEEFEKINGHQDPIINNGTRINYIKLKPNDGVILKSTRTDVLNQVFTNGDFTRVFDVRGKQVQNGFFTYTSEAPANARVTMLDVDGDQQIDTVAERNGKIIITGPGRKTVTIAPFGNNFTGRLSFTVGDFNHDNQKEIVITPLTKGGPQIVTYSQTGKRLSAGFFAYDKDFRGGLNLTVADTDNDGKLEIITAPAKDLSPTVKIFSDKGVALGSFLAYDKNFRGGINLAAGDINGDGRVEIITGAASAGPHIRIFKSTGQLLGQFMAFDEKLGGGVRVMTSDINGDGRVEILAGSSNF